MKIEDCARSAPTKKIADKYLSMAIAIADRNLKRTKKTQYIHIKKNN